MSARRVSVQPDNASAGLRPGLRTLTTSKTTLRVEHEEQVETLEAAMTIAPCATLLVIQEDMNALRA